MDLLSPLELCGLFVGAMLPYAFSALTMKSVGVAANKMVQEIRNQFAQKRRRKYSLLIPITRAVVHAG